MINYQAVALAFYAVINVMIFFPVVWFFVQEIRKDVRENPFFPNKVKYGVWATIAGICFVEFALPLFIFFPFNLLK
jgi:hypothetical protein